MVVKILLEVGGFDMHRDVKLIIDNVDIVVQESDM